MKAHQNLVNEPAVLQVIDPPSAEIRDACVLSLTPEGLLLQVTQELRAGWKIKVRLPELTILAEVLACLELGKTFRVSVRINEATGAQ